jgi:hypothetical protein
MTGHPWPKLVQTESALLVSLSLESPLAETFVDDTSRFSANEAGALLNNNSYCKRSKRRKHSRKKATLVSVENPQDERHEGGRTFPDDRKTLRIPSIISGPRAGDHMYIGSPTH